MTPLSRFERELEWSQKIGEQDVMNFFYADQGHIALLCLAQGIKFLQAYCLAQNGDLINFNSQDPK